jgi:hypothetical protein
MDTTIIFQLVLVFALLPLFSYLAFRAVKWARRSSKGAEFLGSLVGSVDAGSAFNPAQEVLREKRRTKRSDDGSGDPENGIE